MAIRWQIPFRTLRSDSLLTVNVYDNNYNGSPTQLTGGAQPFVTEEDDDDDWFAPVRTQSGYLSIVDTGKDNDGNPFNWRDFIPTTDTDRPVTLTDEHGTILWQGFMQAQNFGSQLYEIPQERQFPVQCVLTVLGAKEMSQNRNIRNFASLLNEMLQQIPTLTISKIVIQDRFDFASDTLTWLFKKVCGHLFYESDDNGNIVSKYTYLELLEEICKYWGLTARVHRQSLYLTKIDDADCKNIFEVTRENLNQSVSNGTDGVSSLVSNFSEKPVGDNFASIENNDYQNRGCGKVTVSANAGKEPTSIIEIFPENFELAMANRGFNIHRDLDDRNYYGYAKVPGNNFENDEVSGTCVTGSEFNLLYFREQYGSDGFYTVLSDATTTPVIRLLDNGASYMHVTIGTTFAHFFPTGIIKFKLNAYRDYKKYESFEDIDGIHVGRTYVRMAFGIGGKWWTPDQDSWSDQKGYFYACVGSDQDTVFLRSYNTTTISRSTISVKAPMYGHATLEIYSVSQGMTLAENGSVIDLANLSIEYQSMSPTDENLKLTKYNKPSRDYVTMNDNSADGEYDVSTIFATYNRMIPGYGIVHNPDGSFYGGAEISGTPTITPPEQLLANRVANYWATSKRKIECELRTDKVEQSAPITPRDLLTIDGTTMWPIAISHDWRDDVTRITAMETYKR